MSYWKDQAATLPQKQLTPFGQLLKKHLKNNLPELHLELLKKSDLLPFLLVQQEQAKEGFNLMVEQGTSPEVARETAIREMMENVSPSPAETPEEQEAEDSIAESALNQWLKSLTPE